MSLISFLSFTFPGAPYRIFLLFLPWLPSHFNLVVIEQQHMTDYRLDLSLRITCVRHALDRTLYACLSYIQHVAFAYPFCKYRAG